MQHVCGGTHRSAVAARIATGSLTSTSSPAASSSRPRHSARAQAAVQAPQIHATAPERETDKYGVERLKLQLKGWDSWRWRGYRVNWTAAGDTGPVILLVHGFGASVYHWRHNILALAKAGHRVFALDMLGFGWSEKPVLDYAGCHVWSEQIRDFVKEVVGGGRVTLVGNSLGGYTSLLTAAKYPDIVNGVVLVNAAGRFEEVQAVIEAPVQEAVRGLPIPGVEADVQQVSGEVLTGPSQTRTTSRPPTTPEASAESASQPLLQRAFEPVQRWAMKAGVYLAFLATKQPARIRQVLRQVYASPKNIDDDLVKSIALPADDPSAAEIFYRVISGWGGKGTPVNQLLGELQAPLLLLWGVLDPWIGAGSADRIQRYYPSADRVELQAGHCPQDDVPEPFNDALIRWVAALPAS